MEIGLTQSDDPQMIFETMNGRGASLTETDLLRNYIFMRANSNEENLDEIYRAVLVRPFQLHNSCNLYNGRNS